MNLNQKINKEASARNEKDLVAVERRNYRIICWNMLNE